MTTLKPGGDLPEHHGHVYAEVTLWYSHAAQRRQWRSGLLTLQAKRPKEDADVLLVGQSLGRAVVKEIFKRPLLSMRRVIA